MKQWKAQNVDQEDLEDGEDFGVDSYGLGKHFAILDLPETASKADIKKSYHKLALKYHPDKYTGNADLGKQMFHKIQAAYEALQIALEF